MTDQPPLNRWAFWSLFISRIPYAINWFNVASIFAIMAPEFGEGVSGLGTLTSSFYLGIGVFQIPGSLLAARIQPKNCVVLGTLVYSTASILCGLANQFWQLEAIRFIVGSGMALVFAPSIILVARHYREGSSGLGIGLFNGAFYIGGAVGIFGWTALATAISWRLSLIIGGFLGLVSATLLFVLVPRDSTEASFRFDAGKLLKVIFSRDVTLLALGGLALTAGSTLVGSFTVYYLIRTYGVWPPAAGAVGGLYMFVEIFSSPLGGRLHDRQQSSRRPLLFSGMVAAVAVAGMGVGGVYGTVAWTIIGGFATGLGFTLLVIATREANSHEHHEFQTMQVAWVNSVSLSASFFPPILFALVVSDFGYLLAWTSAGLSMLFFVAFFVLVRSPTRHAALVQEQEKVPR